MRHKAYFEAHAMNLGKLLGNLQSIEMLARLAIVKLDRRAAEDIQTELSTVKAGDEVELNAFSNKDDLRQTLEKLNKLAPPECRIDVDSVVALRDALAHGRIFGSGPLGSPLRLLKFRRKSSAGRVIVELAVDMTPDWFRSNLSLLEKETEKVRVALDYEKKELV